MDYEVTSPQGLNMQNINMWNFHPTKNIKNRTNQSIIELTKSNKNIR